MDVMWQVFVTWARAHARSERGATLVEYALLLALIVVVCIGAIQSLSKTASAKFISIGSTVGKAS